MGAAMSEQLENKLAFEALVTDSTEVQLTELLFAIITEMDQRLKEGRTPLAFRVVIKDTSN
jgi:hypothetical protein